MKLEDQVVSLELAKKLKELGVKQESLFWWQSYEKHAVYEAKTWVGQYLGGLPKDANYEVIASAFTVAELGEMLPWFIKNTKTRNLDVLKTGKNAYRHWICCYHTTFDPPLKEFIEPSEADARAKMLIYLIENNLVDPKQE